MHLVTSENVCVGESASVQGELFNSRMNPGDLRVLRSEKDVAVICRGFCVFTFANDDLFSRNYCIVQMHLAGGISLSCLSELLGLSYQYCCRVVACYKNAGVEGLRETITKRYGNRRLIDEEVAKVVEAERGRGRTFKEIASIIRFKFKKGIKEKTLRTWMSAKAAAEERAVEQLVLFDPGDSEEGLAEYSSNISEWRRNIYAGSMILYGMLERSGFLRPFMEYIVEDEKRRESSHGVRRVLLALFFLHALRCKSIEQSKHIVGKDFADLVGGDFLRLQSLRDAIDDIVENPGFVRAIDAYYRDLISMTDLGDGFYYTDGHFSSYYGKRHIPKGYDPRRRMGFRGRNTIYLHNSAGESIYFFESPTNTTLSNDIDKLIADMKLFGMAVKRKTLFFVRGGYSAKCFRYLRQNKVYFVTYLKNRKKERECDISKFIVYKIETEDGEEIEYRIFEKERQSTRYGSIRIIVFLGSDGRQIPVIASNPYYRAVILVHVLSRRWREENCFKYMIEHFGIDLLCTYKTEQAPEKIVKRANAARQEVIRLLNIKKVELLRKRAELGEKLSTVDRCQTVGQFFEGQDQLEFAIKNLQIDIDLLERRKVELPMKTEVNLADDHVIIVQKRRLLINAVKAMNYNAEKWLQMMFKEHHAKLDETLSLIRSLWRQSGKIKSEGRVVEVVLDPLDSKLMHATLTKVLEKLKESNHLRLPDGLILRIS